MEKQKTSLKSVVEKIKRMDTNKIKVAIVDIDGILRGKYIHKEKFLSAVNNGFGFCNVVFGWDCTDVCYDNLKYTGWHTGYPDAKVTLDLATYRQVPWDNCVPFFLGDFEDNKGKPLEVCPRQLLKKIIAQSKDIGISPMFGLEFEWFNFKESADSLQEKNFSNLDTLTPGMFGYSLLRSSANRGFFNALLDELEEFEVPLEGLHTETGPGVIEAAIAATDALTAADRGVLFKAATKEIAHRFQIMPSFMAKWDSSLPGCSGHLHQSLWIDDKNVFYDEDSDNKMSKTFKRYLAGQMHCLPEILPFFAPNINSYKRLVEGLWAPTKVAWGVDNRTTAFRVIPGSSSSTRLETRVPGSDTNPYLAVAAALGSGMYGIKNKLSLSEKSVTGNAYTAEGAVSLPKNLSEATDILEKSEVAREIFGDSFVDHFVATRRWEWDKYQDAVTDWELKRYFEII